MSGKKIVIVGLGVGGFSALMSARKTAPEIEMTVIEQRNYDMFSPCGLPFVIEGIIPGIDNIQHHIPTESMGVEKLLNHKARAIDIKNRKLAVLDLTTGSEKMVEFDKLILATGSTPFLPPVPGLKEHLGRGVFTVSCPEDTSAVLAAAKGIEHAVVLGAGPIGLETANSLRTLGLEVAVVEMLDWVFPRALDRDMAGIVEKALKNSGIRLIMGKSLECVNGDEFIESVTVDGQKISAKMLVAAPGMRADLTLARESGIHTGRLGITTDVRMMTSAKDIYAAGDCVEVSNLLINRPWSSQLSNAAYRQGMVAGINAAGGYETYEGSFTTFVSMIGGLEVAATGLNSSFASQYGFNAVSAKARGSTRPNWYPGGEDINIKVLADSITGRLLGAQAVGSGAHSRINVAACAIKGRMTVHDLSDLELAYCPAVSETYDALTKACDYVVRKMKK